MACSSFDLGLDVWVARALLHLCTPVEQPAYGNLLYLVISSSWLTRLGRSLSGQSREPVASAWFARRGFEELMHSMRLHAAFYEAVANESPWFVALPLRYVCFCLFRGVMRKKTQLPRPPCGRGIYARGRVIEQETLSRY